MKKIFTCIRIMILVGMQVSAHSPYAYDLDSDGSVKSYYHLRHARTYFLLSALCLQQLWGVESDIGIARSEELIIFFFV